MFTVLFLLTLSAEPARFSVGVRREEVGIELRLSTDGRKTHLMLHGEKSAVVYPRVPIVLRSRGTRIIEPDRAETDE